jgi:hypothetical protein
MKRAWTVLAVLVAAAPAAAQEPKSNYEHLKSLEWLVGTWEGKGKYGDLPFTATSTHEWTLNKNFIKISTEVKAGGQVIWSDSSMLGWDSEKKKLVSATFGTDGSIGWTELEPDPKEKDTWIWNATNQSGSANFKETRGIMKKVDADTWTETVQKKEGDAYVTFMTTTMKRKKNQK